MRISYAKVSVAILLAHKKFRTWNSSPSIPLVHQKYNESLSNLYNSYIYLLKPNTNGTFSYPCLVLQDPLSHLFYLEQPNFRTDTPESVCKSRALCSPARIAHQGLFVYSRFVIIAKWAFIRWKEDNLLLASYAIATKRPHGEVQ